MGTSVPSEAHENSPSSGTGIPDRPIVLYKSIDYVHGMRIGILRHSDSYDIHLLNEKSDVAVLHI